MHPVFILSNPFVTFCISYEINKVDKLSSLMHTSLAYHVNNPIVCFNLIKIYFEFFFWWQIFFDDIWNHKIERITIGKLNEFHHFSGLWLDRSLTRKNRKSWTFFFVSIHKINDLMPTLIPHPIFLKKSTNTSIILISQ